MGGAWISRNGRGYDGDSCVITVAPKSRTRSSSAARSTVDSHVEIWSATSLPIPSTLRSSLRFATRTCCGSLKTSSNFRSLTGPTVGSMLSVMHASVAFMIGSDASVPARRSESEAYATLKWDLVLVGLGACWWFGRCAGLPIFPSRLAGSASSSGTTAQQLHGLAHYTQSRSLLPGLFVVPGIHLQAALDKHGPSFLQIFTCNLRKARPEYNVDKRDFLTSFSAVGSVSAIDGNAEIANCAALGCVTHFGVAGEVSKQNDFVKTGHGRVIPESLSFRHLFSGLFLLLGQAFVILTIHFRIEFKFRLQLRDYSRIGNKDKVHVISGIERTGHIGELALVHFLHLFDLRTFFLKLRFQSVDDFPDGFFFALGVQHQQRFITAVHASSVSVLLKVFIAETSPLSIAHFNASTARPIVDLTSGFSSSKNRFST